MYDFNSDVATTQSSGGSRFSMFAEGVKNMRLAPQAGETKLFRILPAHDPNTAQTQPDGSITVDPNSLVTFRTADGRLNPWGRIVKVAKFVGHGVIGKGGSRKDIVSLSTYSNGEGEVFCPYQQLIDYASKMPQWKYLFEDTKDASGRITERRALSRHPDIVLIFNMIDAKNPAEGVQIGQMSKSASDALIGKNGLACQRNVSATQEMLQQNPMMEWACGDITDPATGPVFLIQKDPNPKGKFTGFVVEYATDGQGKIIRMPVDAAILQQRYNLLDINSIVPKPTEEEIVNTLVEALNQFSPSGVHEYELLKAVFGHSFKIPDPPAQAYSPGLGAAPKVAAPVTNTFSVPAPAVPAPAPAPAPVPAPAAPAPAPVAAAPAVPAPAPAPAAPAPAPAAAAPAEAAGPIPGEAAPAFDRDAFLSRLKSANK